MTSKSNNLLMFTFKAKATQFNPRIPQSGAIVKKKSMNKILKTVDLSLNQILRNPS